MLLAPVVVLPLLVAAGLTGLLSSALGIPATVTAVLVIGLLVLLTRAIHLDGLADTADGLSASYERERALVVMRTGDVGPSGVAAVALTLLLQAAALASLLADGHGMVLAGCALLASRHTLAWACRRGVPAARAEGLGATMAGSVAAPALGTVVLVLAVLTGAVSAWTGAWWHGPVVLAVAVTTSALITRRALARLGGVTGDVLGAGVELSLAAALIAAAALV